MFVFSSKFGFQLSLRFNGRVESGFLVNGGVLEPVLVGVFGLRMVGVEGFLWAIKGLLEREERVLVEFIFERESPNCLFFNV